MKVEPSTWKQGSYSLTGKLDDANWRNANLKNEVEITQQFVNVCEGGGDLGSTKGQSRPLREGSRVG